MTLLIAWMVVYGLHLDGSLYAVSLVVWVLHLVYHEQAYDLLKRLTSKGQKKPDDWA